MKRPPTDVPASPPLPGSRAALPIAIVVSAGFYVIAGLAEAALVQQFHPSARDLDWISDAVLSSALGTAVYLWLNLRASRLVLSERERAQVALHAQLSLAEAMQRRLLPSAPPHEAGLAWAARLQPAGQIGGDFYDFCVSRAGARFMLIADVSGKGVAAAMALTLVRATFRNLAHGIDSSTDLATAMSRQFHEEWQGTPYVTAVVARVDLVSRTLTYTNAGHPHGILVRGGQARSLSVGGPPLGLLPGAGFREDRVDLRPGDLCAFVTDGVSEAMELPRSWRDAVLESASATQPPSADAVCQAVLTEAARGHGPAGVEDWSDDRTVVVLSADDVAPVTGPSSAP